MEEELVQATFVLRFSTKFGQELLFLGNSETLGDNRPETALAMAFRNENEWAISLTLKPGKFRYQYLLKEPDGKFRFEARERQFDPEEFSRKRVIIIDTWNDLSQTENVFFTKPFQNVLLETPNNSEVPKPENPSHSFKILAPLLRPGEQILITGNSEGLGNWDPAKGLRLGKIGQPAAWAAHADLSGAELPLEYKYAVFSEDTPDQVKFENGPNRIIAEFSLEALTVLSDGFIRLPNNIWRGAGVAIPVFSLRSSEGLGVGEFLDIKNLAEWAASVRLRLIQLLPVNDTQTTGAHTDSYPYSAISAFALHPLYLNLDRLVTSNHTDYLERLANEKRKLNALSVVDYEEVIRLKLIFAREAYEFEELAFVKDPEFIRFFGDNNHWLLPYAVFSYLRDVNETADFSKWPSLSTYEKSQIEAFADPSSTNFTQIAFFYYLQFHLHLQLKEASEFAHQLGVVLKGDVPIGIGRNSCDAWVNPKLYRMDQQAGAPPDNFAAKGQNWGFPTYNWEEMRADDYHWWKQRFAQMEGYFDVIRIDHILGFLRIWSIPLEAVEGILGRFVRAIPVRKIELVNRGIRSSINRLIKPYITDDVLEEIFPNEGAKNKEEFLRKVEENNYVFKEEYNTQRKIEKYLGSMPETDIATLRQGLYDLISNIILIEDPSEKDAFHFRISIDKSLSLAKLDEAERVALWELYIDYFFRRQDDFWGCEAIEKLSPLKLSTRMLICGEDLGMVPESVPGVLQALAILSLEVQRMSKNAGVHFFNPDEAPYLSVTTPGTHDMSTIKGWWNENRAITQTFYNDVLKKNGEAPPDCAAWINQEIITQHLHSPAMWAIFMLQDIMGMGENLNQENPDEERINIPGDPKHYWRYRMRFTMEELIGLGEFNDNLRDMIIKSGRA